MTERIYGVNGLRALAVLAVLGFHAFPGAMAGGFIGVDVFFVISGYIITKIYLDRLLCSQVSLPEFFARRVRRLAPVYILVLAACSIAAYALLEPPLLQSYGASLVAQPLYLQNFWFWLQGDYFDRALTKPLLHTWSLGVEEQFYLGLGALVLACRTQTRRMLPILLTGALFSLFVGLEVGPLSPKTSFYLLPTRVWEFAIGIAVARLRGAGSPALRSALEVVGVLCVIAAIVLFGADSPFPGRQALVACAGSAIVLWSVGQRNTPSLFLDSKGMDYIGRLSYSLYLWHWPIIVFATIWLEAPLDAGSGALALAASGVLSVLSFHFVEEPVRHRRVVPETAILLRRVGGFGFAFGALGLLFNLSGGLVGRYPPRIAKLYDVQTKRSPYRCSLLARLRSFPDEMCLVSSRPGARNILLLGDSHADQLDETIARIGDGMGVGIYLATRNCVLGRYGESDFCAPQVLEHLAADMRKHRIEYVFAVAHLTRDIQRQSMLRDAKRVLAGPVKGLYVMQVVPGGKVFDPQQHVIAIRTGRKIADGIPLSEYLSETAKQRQVLSNLASLDARVTLVDPAPYLCPQGWCMFEYEGGPLYLDDNHLSPGGVEKLLPLLRATVAKVSADWPAGQAPVAE